MALFRKFFYRKPPDGLLEISERVYVFDCCFTTDVLEENEYKVYMEGIVAQLRDHFPDSSFMVFNFREGENQSQISAILSEYDMTVMDYPRQYEGCPLLALEVIHHFLRSSESWLLLAQQNILLMHCERGGWPVLAFMLAALLVYRKQYTGEQRTLDIIYKQAPRELLQLLSPLNPLPSQMRYLQYISRRNVSTEWPPLDRALTLDCVILRLIPDFDGQGGARPIFRIYGQDPLLTSDRTTKVLFSTPKKSNLVRIYKQADCELVKIDIDCHIQGDVVLECINIDQDLEREVMMFRVMFNTAFIRSNILMLNRDAVDILWDAKDRFPKDFRVEVLLSEMDAAMSRATLDFITAEDKEGLPIEAFAAVQEIFSVDWEDTKGDASLKVLQQLSLSNSFQDKFISFQDQLDVSSPKLEFDYLLQGSSPDKQQDRQQPDGTDKGSKNISPSSLEKDQTAFVEKTDFVTVNQNIQEKLHAASVPKVESHKMSKILSHDKPKDKVEHSIIDKKSKNSPNFSPEKAQIFPLGKTPPDLVIKNENIKTHDLKFAIQRPNQIKVASQRLPLSRSTPAFSSNSLQVSAMPASRYKSAPSMLGITALLEDDGPFESSHVIKTSTSSHSISSNNVPQGSSAHLPPPPRSSSFENLREKIPIASPPPLPPHSPPPPPPPAAPTSLMSSATSIPTNAIAKVSDISLELPPPSLETSSTVCSILKEQLLPSSSQDSSYSAESLLKVSPAVYAPPSPPPTPSTSAISSSKTSGSLGRVSSGLVNQPTLSNISDMPVPNSAHPPPSLPLPSINLSSPFPQSLKKVADSASIPQLPPLSSQLGPSISSTAAKEPPSPPPLLPSLQLDHSISSEKKAPSPSPPPSLPLSSPSPPLSQLDSSISSAAEKAPSLPPPLPPPMPLLPSSQLDSCTSATKKAPLPPPPLPPLSRLDSSIYSTANKALTPPTPPPLPSPSTPPLPSQLGPSISSTEAKRPSPPPPSPLPHPSEFGASISSAATKQPTPALSPQTLSTPSVGLGSKQSLAPPVPPPPPSQAGHAISLAISKVPPPPPPPQPFSKPSSGLGSEMSVAPPVPPPLPSQVGSSKPLSTTKEQPQPPIPPPPPSDDGPANYLAVTKAPVPPPPPPFSSKPSVGVNSKSSPAPPVPPPPMISISSKNTGTASSQLNSGAKVGAAEVVPPPPLNGMGTPGGKGRGLARVAGPRTSSTQSTSKRANLKPLHWVKVTRAMQGSLWAETQKSDELIKAPEFDMSELESLFSAAMPSGGRDSSEKSNSRSAAAKPDKVHLIDLRRANNCEIMLTKVKMPLQDLMSSVLTLDDSDLDIDQIENLIKFCPTKEEMDLLKGYSGDKESLGKCEQYFLELMRIPRVESKMRVFSFKIQFNTQVSDLRNNLNVVKSVAGEIRSSVKLKRIMQTILSLGNALNQGTARGSAIGFRLDSLLKLTDTRARNNKMTLMHYLCKVLAEKLPELLDFPKDLGSLEGASKIQLKILAEEMQAISKGLEKVEQELTTSENDGPVSQTFRKTLKDFLVGAEAEVRALASLYSNVGRNADALALYFGEDPARCPFEQVVSTLLNFVRMFVRAHEENCKQLELEKKKAQKEAENGKLKVNSNLKEQQSSIPSPTKREADAR